MSFSLPSTLADGRHRYPVRVYYEDTDAGGIVYHASYLRFAERARTEALRALGVPHAELVGQHGLIFVVRRVKLDYVRPAGVDDSLTVVTEPVALGAASVALRQVFVSQAGDGCTVLARGEIGLACVRIEGNRPARMPERWQAALGAMLAAGAARRNGG
ncbi:MAG: tol-pal system-associated acyl-CoA thioesterase [Acidisphaera sp.]|nr:tol-pal system-associated acyl-CoA thioesterase [Acidisphaera sp.]